MNINYRKTTIDDAYGVAYVSAHSWKETYTGFMPDDYLNNRIANIENKLETTKKFLQDKDTYYVATVDDRVVGICYYNKSENEKYHDYGLLGAIYVLKDYQKLGIGKELFKIAIKGLIDMGYNKMYLECLKGNPTINFYKHFDGEIVETINYRIEDFSVKADIVLFNDLEKILKYFNEENNIKR